MLQRYKHHVTVEDVLRETGRFESMHVDMYVMHIHLWMCVYMYMCVDAVQSRNLDSLT